jgi:hypothetical protein
MRRLLMGIVWFFVLLFVITLAFTLPASMTAKLEPGMSAEQAGYDAGRRVQSKYGFLFVLAAAGLSAAGTYKRILPGTRKRTDADG